MEPMTVGELLGGEPGTEPVAESTMVEEVLTMLRDIQGELIHCMYDGCNDSQTLFVAEVYTDGGDRFLDLVGAAVCQGHLPQCAGGEDPKHLWNCGRPHFVKVLRGKDVGFEPLHIKPWESS